MIPIRDTLPSQSKPLMNWLLILINGWVFWYQLGLGPAALEAWLFRLGVVPSEVMEGYASPVHWLSWLTTMFVHGGWFHIISNLWALWIFGDNVEDRMGRPRYLLFYLLCGLGGTLAHVAFNPASDMPVVGASGAISGVMAAYLVLFPQSRIVTLVPLLFIPLFFRIPAVIYILFWIGMELFTGIQQHSGWTESAGVAVWAHVGGFVTGVLLHRLFLLGEKEAGH